MSAAELALWARVEDLSREEVTRALWVERTLAKTWCMRGAAHLIAADDLPVFVGGVSRLCLPRERRWIVKYGINETEMDAMVDAVVEALADRPLTRKELAKRVVARLGDSASRWVEHSWGGIVKQASLEGSVVFGPNHGQEITFVKRDLWLPHVKDLPTEEAETMLLRRYLHGYGPANLADFAAWAGMTCGEAAPLRERAGGEIIDVEVEGKTCLVLREDLPILRSTEALDEEEDAVRLLPSFDCYMLGHRDKDHIVDRANYKRIYRKAGWLSPVLLIGGRACGVWNCTRKGKLLHVRVEPFSKISVGVRKRVEEEVADLARFYNAICRLSFTN